MNRTLSPALRALLLRHAFLASILLSGAALSTGMVACGGSDSVTPVAIDDAGDGATTTKPDGSAPSDAGGNVDAGGDQDSSIGVDSGSDAGEDAALADADAADAALDADATPPVPLLNVDDIAVDEGSSGTTSLTFTVTLSAASTETVTVAYATADGTATTSAGAVGGADYTASNGNLTFAPGDTTKTVTIFVSGDTTNEPDETFTITLSSPANATLSRASAAGTITNDDAVPTLSIDDKVVTEGNSATKLATFAVTLSAASAQTVSVHYKTTDGTATAGSDFTGIADTTLTFNPGETSKAVDVTINGDVTVESNEAFTVDLSAAANASITKAAGTGTIQNDDGAVLPTLTINDVSLSEGDASTKVMSFTVTLSAIATQVVTVDYATANATAISGASADYEATNGTLTFGIGESSKTVSVNIKGDTANEVDETFAVDLSNATNANISDAQGTGTIVNDDPVPTLSIGDASVVEGQAGSVSMVFTVTLSAASGKAVGFTYETFDGTAKGLGQDFGSVFGTTILPAGTTTYDFSVEIAGDVLNEANETFTVTVSIPSNATIADANAIGTIINDDALPIVQIEDATVIEGNSGTTTMTFNVSLVDAALNPAPSGQTVSVAYATQNGAAAAGSDFTTASGTVTFAAGETQKMVTVDVTGDTTAETNETFNVNLSSPINATVNDATAIGTITNDDGTLPFLNINNQSVTEGNAGSQVVTFTVTLSAASAQTVTVDYGTEDNTAIAGGVLDSGGQDYVATSGTLSFAAGETQKTITVTVNGDVADEPTQSYRVLLSNVSSNAAIQDGSGLGTIFDDDAAPLVSVGNASTTEGNSGTKSLTFTVTLSAKSGRTVSVAYATSNGTAVTAGASVSGGNDYESASGTVTFAAGETSKTFNVVVNGDTTREGSETFGVTLSAPSFATLGDASGTGTITNDDAVPGISIADVSSNEGTPAPATSSTTTFSFLVTLSNSRSTTITVAFATQNGSANAADYTAASGTLTFLPGETSKTINIAVSKDSTFEPNETFFVNLSNPSGATLLDNAATGTILNDDFVIALP